VRKLVVLLGGLLVLATANLAIWQKEDLLANGRVVLLPLAPVDPRSLMQGDYMALRFQLATDAFRWTGAQWSSESRKDMRQDGFVVAALDGDGVATFRRIDDGNPLAADEVRIRFRVRNGEPKIGTNAFFFQEGHARYYERARFGEIRLAPDGDLLLTALRGAERQRLGPAAATTPDR
jgi:uncharacterized membrane-anchored protein